MIHMTLWLGLSRPSSRPSSPATGRLTAPATLIRTWSMRDTPCVGMGGVRTALTEAGWRPAMVERQEVEALLALVEAEKGRWSPHVPAPTLAALCRAWLAVEDAPTVEVTQCNQLPGTPDFDHGDMAAAVAGLTPGQRVRIVKEVG